MWWKGYEYENVERCMVNEYAAALKRFRQAVADVTHARSSDDPADLEDLAGELEGISSQMADILRATAKMSRAENACDECGRTSGHHPRCSEG